MMDIVVDSRSRERRPAGQDVEALEPDEEDRLQSALAAMEDGVAAARTLASRVPAEERLGLGAGGGVPRGIDVAAGVAWSMKDSTSCARTRGTGRGLVHAAVREDAGADRSGAARGCDVVGVVDRPGRVARVAGVARVQDRGLAAGVDARGRAFGTPGTDRGQSGGRPAGRRQSDVLVGAGIRDEGVEGPLTSGTGGWTRYGRRRTMRG